MMTHEFSSSEISLRGILNCPEASVLSPADERELLNELVACRRQIEDALAVPDRSEWRASAIETDFQQVVRDLANTDSGADREAGEIGPTARRYQEIRSKLAMSNVRLVAHIAKRYNDRGVSPADLIQEGFCGLLLAIDRFDTTNESRLATYAIWWIRQAIQRAVAACAYPVRLNPKQLHQLAQGQHLVDPNDWHSSAATTEPAEAGPSTTIERLIAATRPTISLDSPRGPDGTTSLLDFLMNRVSEDETSAEDLHEDIRALMKLLNPREQRVLNLRFGLSGEHRHSLVQVGEILGVSKERVRQIQERSLQKLRQGARRQPVSEAG